MARASSNRAAQLAQLVEHGTFNSREDPLEKGMATYSSILAWRIPWIAGPGRLEFMESRESDMTERLTFSHFSSNRAKDCSLCDRLTALDPVYTGSGRVHSPPGFS